MTRSRIGEACQAAPTLLTCPFRRRRTWSHLHALQATACIPEARYVEACCYKTGLLLWLPAVLQPLLTMPAGQAAEDI